MRRAALLAVLASLLLLGGCDLFPGSPTMSSPPTATAVASSSQLATATPSFAPSPTAIASATRVPPTFTATLPPPTPLPRPTDWTVRLGSQSGNTYDPQAVVLDRERGRAYILGLSGEVAPQGQSVITVVDLGAGVPLASAPLAKLSPACTATLSADGARLYIATGRGKNASLLVVSTGISGGKLGELLASRAGVQAIALEVESGRLFALDATHLRRLNAQTLAEEAAAPFAGMPPLPAQIRMVVNHAAGRVYIIRPDHQAVAIYRADDLQPEPDLKPEGDLAALLADPTRAQTYVLCQHFTTGDTQSSVAVLRGGRVAAVWRTELGYQIGQLLMDETSSRLLLLEDSWSLQDRHSRLRTLQPESGQLLSAVRMPYLDSVYARGQFTYSSQLYRLDNDLASVRLSDGQFVQALPLGIELVSITMSEDSERLAALDSSGMIHILDATSLTPLRSYPALDFRQNKIEAAPLAYLGNRLYIGDEANSITLVFEAETGKRLFSLPKFGQVIQDARRQRLYLVSQGIYQINADYQLSAAIPETVPAPSSSAPGAVGAAYDAAHDWLLVKMSNNAPGAGRSEWLQAYEAETLRRVAVELKMGQRFITDMLALANGQIWISGSFPNEALAAFEGQGRQLKLFPDIGGMMYASPTGSRLYLSDGSELVTVDMASLTISDRRALPNEVSLCAADLARGRFYAAQARAPHLLVMPIDAKR